MNKFEAWWEENKAAVCEEANDFLTVNFNAPEVNNEEFKSELLREIASRAWNAANTQIPFPSVVEAA